MRYINKRLFNTHTSELNWTELNCSAGAYSGAQHNLCVFFSSREGGGTLSGMERAKFLPLARPWCVVVFSFFFSSRRPPNKRCTSLKYITPASPAQPSSSCVSFCFSQHRISQRQHPFQTKHTHTHKHIYVLSFLLCFLKRSRQFLSVLFSLVCVGTVDLLAVYRSNRWPASLEMIIF
jgi:hypothetical protein